VAPNAIVKPGLQRDSSRQTRCEIRDLASSLLLPPRSAFEQTLPRSFSPSISPSLRMGPYSGIPIPLPRCELDLVLMNCRNALRICLCPSLKSSAEQGSPPAAMLTAVARRIVLSASSAA
jgi:hypothetical protein